MFLPVELFANLFLFQLKYFFETQSSLVDCKLVVVGSLIEVSILVLKVPYVVEADSRSLVVDGATFLEHFACFS